MKKQLILFGLLLFSICSFGQDIIELKEKSDYKKAEPMVIKICSFLFNNPVTHEKETRQAGASYIVQWMSGTPDYTFTVTQEGMQLIGSKQEYMALYMAAQTMVVLENKDKKLTPEQIEKGGIDLLINYCSNPANNIKLSKSMKKYKKKNGV
ncbi:hypothetical protein MY04_2115 [Flammeovirga sp. MY04]|uniref:hypothetical protein n=1 Tax=Flammeovirga sp. MY04 TaxID=1191459 RepID=UPI0008063764|nr:hypothetical protein [Flammeovirga sp. MY04]ANQ49489.1 hypothetical protein MY04_2115 [Flammeovirga sp. MY04]